MRFWISLAVTAAFFLGLTLGEKHRSHRDEARRSFNYDWNRIVCGQRRCEEISR